MLNRINDLIKDMPENPFSGIEKPGPLKGRVSGYWSRRIDNAHRLVYSFLKDRIHII